MNNPTDSELRDELASLMGWTFRHNSWWHPTIPSLYHPFPPNELNPLMEVWYGDLKGWDWEKRGGFWYAWMGPTREHVIHFQRTGNFYTDFLKLTVLTVKAERNK